MTPGGPTRTAPAGATAAYESYFASGNYDRRYPAPNLHVMACIERCLAMSLGGGHVIDYGCGSGRYLAALRGRAAVVAGFDISEAALSLLRDRLRLSDGPPVHILGPDPAELDQHLARYGPADLVICLFGVLGHITDPAVRRDVLRTIKGLLRPDTGRLLVSVPNRFRRFWGAQWRAGHAAGGAIRYTRAFADGPVTLDYQLFTPTRLRRELDTAGCRVCWMRAESLLPESWLTRNDLARQADASLAPLLPAVLGYGLLAEARPA